MKQFRFRALVTVDGAAPGGPPPAYPCGTHQVMVHAHLPGTPAGDWYFPAVLSRDDEQPLSAGDHALVTITVTDDDAGHVLAPGRHFALWAGRDVGRGVISRRIFVSSGPC